MKIRIAILEQDKNYLQRLLAAFETKYEDKIEMYSFTDEQLAMEAVENTKINVFLASDKFSINKKSIPDKCGFAYLTDTMDVELEDGTKTICKFQKIDMIYKEIVSLHSENASSQTKSYDDGGARIIAFASPSGGTGSSTMAVACAKYFVKCGKKVLYFNTEELGESSTYFSGEGQFTFDDVIYAVKSKKTNMTLKFESTVKQDASGVYFFAPGKMALDAINLSHDESVQLIMDLKMSNIFDVIIWDTDFKFDLLRHRIMEKVSDIVMTCDGSELSVRKFKRMYESVDVLEKQRKIEIVEKLWVVYNQFSNKTGTSVGIPDVKELGGAPKYERATVNQVADQLVAMNLFEKLLV